MKLSDNKIKEILNIQNIKIYLSYLRINKLYNDKKYLIEIEIDKEYVRDTYIIIEDKDDPYQYKRIQLSSELMMSTSTSKYTSILRNAKILGSDTISFKNKISYQYLLEKIIKDSNTNEELYQTIMDIDPYIHIVSKLFNFVMDTDLFKSYTKEKINSKVFFDKFIDKRGRDITEFFYKLYNGNLQYIKEHGLKMTVTFLSHRDLRYGKGEEELKDAFFSRKGAFSKYPYTILKDFTYEVKNIKYDRLQYNILTITVFNKEELREAFNITNFLFSDILSIRRDLIIQNLKWKLSISKYDIELIEHESILLKNIVNKFPTYVDPEKDYLLVDLSN